MGKRKNIQTFTMTWNRVAIEVSYEPNWLSMPESTTAHIEVTATDPEREPLPITETGFRSHFCSPEEVEGAGGPVAYVTAWLEAEARSPKWKAADMARRQLSLF